MISVFPLGIKNHTKSEKIKRGGSFCQYTKMINITVLIVTKSQPCQLKMITDMCKKLQTIVIAHDD